MTKIRILHVLAALNSGGIERMLYNYYSHMNRENLQFDFIVHGDEIGMLEPAFENMGSRIYHTTPKRENLRRNLMQIKQVIYSDPPYDMIHCHQDGVSFIPLRMARKRGIKARILHAHGIGSDKRSIKILSSRYLAVRNANVFLACSKEAAELIYGRNILHEQKVTIIPNAIDESLYRFNPLMRDSTRCDLHLEGKYVIGHVGRFSPEKNHEFILQIFDEVYRRDRTSVLLLIGDGPLELQIKAHARRLDAKENIIFLGSRNDVPRLMQAMDCLLLPSLHEGLGMSLIEAQAAGLKCFASLGVPKEANITGLVEYLPLDEGPTIWANAILRYKNGYQRETQTEKFAERDYDIGKASRELETLYSVLYAMNSLTDK